MSKPNWKKTNHQSLVSHYDPLTSLLNAKLDANPKVDEALQERGAVRGVVSAGQFYVQTADGRKALTEPIKMGNTPDMRVYAALSQEGEIVLELDKPSEERLVAIDRGEQTIAQNIGIDQQREQQSQMADSIWGIEQSHSQSRGLSQ
jgi:osmotically-inducible protein OsmY